MTPAFSLTLTIYAIGIILLAIPLDMCTGFFDTWSEVPHGLVLLLLWPLVVAVCVVGVAVLSVLILVLASVEKLSGCRFT